jgi:hypothetical protein
MPSENSGNPTGRPPVKKKKNPIGRPKGEAAIMKGYRERMLNSPKSRKVLTAILDAALDDDHKNQAAAWKIVVDRIMPVSSFEKLAGSTQRNAIQINISGVPGVDISGPDGAEDVLEGEFSPSDTEAT